MKSLEQIKRENNRIADNDWTPKHAEAILTLNSVAIELKIYLHADTMPRTPEITQELVDRLEAAIRDIEKCREPSKFYR